VDAIFAITSYRRSASLPIPTNFVTVSGYSHRAFLKSCQTILVLTDSVTFTVKCAENAKKKKKYGLCGS
jgi:hypothetical protein